MTDEHDDESQWEEGDAVAVVALGVTEIAEVAEGGALVIRDRGSTLDFSAEEVERRVRPLVDVETAKAIREAFGTLGEPNEADRAYDRKKAYREVARRNDLREMTATLEGIYRHPDPGYPEERYLERFTEAVFKELGKVLDEDREELAREARAACGLQPD